MRQLSKTDKQNKTSILNSNTEHKNTSGAIAYCNRKNEQYELIFDNDYLPFLNKMGKNKKFVFTNTWLKEYIKTDSLLKMEKLRKYLFPEQEKKLQAKKQKYKGKL